MAMSESSLASEIEAAINAVKVTTSYTTGVGSDGTVSTQDDTKPDTSVTALANAIAKAVVKHIQDNAEISGTGQFTTTSPGAGTGGGPAPVVITPQTFAGNFKIPPKGIQ